MNRSLRADEVQLVPPSRFEQLFTRHRGELVRLATAVTGDAEAAEDIVQEAFMKLSRSEVLGRDDAEALGWLRRVCVNAALNVLRANRRGREGRARLALVTESLAPERERPDAQALRREEQERVRAALDAIPDGLRACLVLRHSGYSYAEIAAALGLAMGSVGVYLARGERAFRSHYEEQET